MARILGIDIIKSGHRGRHGRNTKHSGSPSAALVDTDYIIIVTARRVTQTKKKTFRYGNDWFNSTNRHNPNVKKICTWAICASSGETFISFQEILYEESSTYGVDPEDVHPPLKISFCKGVTGP